MSVVALVPAAGRGERLGRDLAKAFVPIAGEPMLVHAVRGVFGSGCVDAVVVAAPSPDLATTAAMLAPFGDRVSVVAGGTTRTESVRLALAHLPRSVDVVLVHDAARPFTPPPVFAAVVAAVRGGAGAVVPVIPLVDTVKRVDGDGRILSTVERTTLRSVQTPQGFAPDLLRRAYDRAADAATEAVTDDAGLVEALGEPVHAVPGSPSAFKITTPFDLRVAEAMMAE